jgi:hypothetical protein
MPRGGPRPGFGGKQPGAGRRPQPKPTEATEAPTGRPRFANPREFGMWALNAPDNEVTMDQKARIMQALLASDGKKPAERADPKPADVVSGGLYAPRALAVVRGGKT